MKNIILFDLDGTLLNTLGDLHAAVNHVMRDHGMPERSLEEVRSFVGNGVGLLIRRACPQGTGEEEMAQCLAEFKAWYQDHSLERTAPYAGIPQVLGKCSGEGAILATVSNKFEAAVKDLCDITLPGLMDICVGDLEGYPRKPDPANVFRAISQASQGEDYRAIYVGDSETDVETAKNANLPLIAVTWGFRSTQVLMEAGAQTLVNSASELETLLLDWIHTCG